MSFDPGGWNKIEAVNTKFTQRALLLLEWFVVWLGGRRKRARNGRQIPKRFYDTYFKDTQDNTDAPSTCRRMKAQFIYLQGGDKSVEKQLKEASKGDE